MPRKKVPLRYQGYRLIERAVEQGISNGWRKAHKHSDKPTKAVVEMEMERAITFELSEIINFDEDTIGGN